MLPGDLRSADRRGPLRVVRRPVGTAAEPAVRHQPPAARIGKTLHMTASHNMISHGVNRRKGWVASSSLGRFCAAEGCITMLSIYNPSSWCWVHHPATFQPGCALHS